MSELAKLPEAQELNDQQRRFVAAMLDGKSEAEALKAGAYANTVLAQHVLRSRAVQAALKAGGEAKLSGALYIKAINTLEQLMDSGPAATRFNAAKLVVEQRKGAEDSDKPLSEMTEAELMAVIDRAQERIEAARQPELKDVTPRNGA